MVFIHGDDYLFGGLEDYPPLPLLNHPVVLVVLQYRLGVLGKSVEEKGSGPARDVRNRIGLAADSLLLGGFESIRVADWVLGVCGFSLCLSFRLEDVVLLEIIGLGFFFSTRCLNSLGIVSLLNIFAFFIKSHFFRLIHLRFLPLLSKDSCRRRILLYLET